VHPIVILFDDFVVDVGVILKNGLKGPGAFKLVISTTPGGREAPFFLFTKDWTQDKELIDIIFICFFMFLQHFIFNMLVLLK
jgi:hypothetical protein